MAKKNVARYGVMIALACIFSYIETLIPFEMIGIPGVKLGLANLVVVVTLYTFGLRDALFISLVRVLLMGFAFNPSAIAYGIAGGLLSLTVMALLMAFLSVASNESRTSCLHWSSLPLK